MENEKHHDELPPELERYLALCQRVYERMKRDNSWPWASDSTKADGLVESEDNPTDV